MKLYCLKFLNVILLIKLVCIIVKYISTSYLQVDTGIAPEICRLFPWTRLDLRGKLIGNYIDTRWCSKRQGIGLYSVKHIQKSSKGQENQSRITQGNGLDRCRIRQVLLYILRGTSHCHQTHRLFLDVRGCFCPSLNYKTIYMIQFYG